MQRFAYHVGFRSFGGITLLLAFSWLNLPALRAEEEATADAFSDGMKQLSAEVAKFLEQRNEKSLIVGPFTGPPATGGGPGIEQGIKQNLPATIDTTPKLGVLGLSGSYRLSKDRSSGRNCIIVEASIKDSLGESVQDITRYILTDEQSVQRLMAGNGPLPIVAPPGKTLDEARDDALLANIKKPAFAIETADTSNSNALDSIIRLPGTKFGVEILAVVAGQYVPQPVVNQKGLPFVELSKDQMYAVRLINDGPDPMGAAVFIDGINSLAFSDNADFREVGKWVVRSGNLNATIKGWHTTGNESASFLVTEYGDSVAGRAGIVGAAIGTISVQFFTAFAGNPPRDEPEAILRARGDLATGQGPLVDQGATPVRMNFGVSRGQISIRYTREHAGDLPEDAPK